MPFIQDSPVLASRPDLNEWRRREHHEADVVIVGAGIAGCALAVAMGQQGRSVILLEKNLSEPDRIVGELLQPGGIMALEKLGLQDCVHEIDSVPVHGYEIFYHHETVNIAYPENANGQNEKRRPEGRSFHHGRFVQRLRDAAQKTANVYVVETKATELVKDEWTGHILGVECHTGGKPDYYFGALTVISDGYASKFRKLHTEAPPVVKSKFFGLELLDAKLPRPNHGHVVLGDFPPVLLYQIGTHETRILVDIPNDCPSASVAAGGVKGHMRNVVLPNLPESVKPSFEKALESQVIRSMPNSWLPPKTNSIPGIIFLGDALNMRHPLTGGGMTVAFNDAVLLADLLSPANCPRLDDSKLVLKQLKSFHWQRKDITSVINILAQALYSLFAANDANLRALQRGCFSYFQLGGNCVDGPCGLLAGIIRNPMVLVSHFFSVALYAIWIEANTYPKILLPFTLIWRGVSLLATAVVVIAPYIWAELRV